MAVHVTDCCVAPSGSLAIDHGVVGIVPVTGEAGRLVGTLTEVLSIIVDYDVQAWER